MERYEQDGEEQSNVRDMRKTTWAWFDKDLLEQYGEMIGPYGIAVYIALAMHDGKNDGAVYPSLKRLAHLSGISKSKVCDILNLLEKVDLIERIRRDTPLGDFDTTVYVLKELKRDIQRQGNPYHGLPMRHKDREGLSSDKKSVRNKDGLSTNTDNRGHDSGRPVVLPEDMNNLNLKEKNLKREDKSANEVSFAPAPQGFSQHDSDEDQQPKRLVRIRRPGRHCPNDFEVTEEMYTWAAENFPTVDVERETAAFRDHEYPRPYSDWGKAWRNWIRKALELQQRTPHPGYQRSANGYQARGAAAPRQTNDPVADRWINRTDEPVRASHKLFDTPLPKTEELPSPEEIKNYMAEFQAMFRKTANTMDMNAAISRENRPRRLGIVQDEYEPGE